MQPDRFTIKSQEALQAAQQLADERHNPQTTPEHLLAVLLEQDGGVVVPVLRKLGVEPAAVRQRVGAALDALPKLTTAAGEPAGGSGELIQILRAPSPRCASSTTSTSRPSTCCWRCRRIRAAPATRCAQTAPRTTSCSRRSTRSAARTA